jgi:hypothetical protein
MPLLVYVSREKRPAWPHHFKAGALNALVSGSSTLFIDKNMNQFVRVLAYW